jgi:hypothetical protein
MKKLIALFVLAGLSVQAPAQDCKLNLETDPYTKEKKLSTGFISLENSSLTIDADKREIDLFFSLEGADKCFDNSSAAAIFFEGTKVKLTIRNGGTMNCDGYFHFIFKNTATPNSSLRKLMEKKLTHIVFTGNNKKETTLNFSEGDQDAIMKLVNCLVSEAAKLAGT